MYQVCNENYYNVGNTENYLVQTQSQTESSGIKLPEVHGTGKEFRFKHPTRKTTYQSHKR